MSLVSPPQALVVGTATPLTPPANSPWAAAVIQNLSPYLIEVQAGSQVAWLAPFTSDIFAPGPTQTPISATPQAIAGSISSTVGGAQVQATWYNPDEAAALEATYPTALPGSAVLAAAAPPGLIIPAQTFVAAGGQIIIPNVAIPTNVRTLVIALAHLTPLTPIVVTNVVVEGLPTGNQYYNQPPYLQVGPAVGPNSTNALIVVPFPSVIDTTVQITITTAQNLQVKMVGDSSIYDESVFYNGTHQVVTQNVNTGPTSKTLVTGPARLLYVTAAVNSGGNAIVTVNGQNTLNPQSQAGSNGTIQTVTFPDNTILQAGQAVVGENLNNGIFSDIACGFAYP